MSCTLITDTSTKIYGNSLFSHAGVDLVWCVEEGECYYYMVAFVRDPIFREIYTSEVRKGGDPDLFLAWLRDLAREIFPNMTHSISNNERWCVVNDMEMGVYQQEPYYFWKWIIPKGH